MSDDTPPPGSNLVPLILIGPPLPPQSPLIPGGPHSSLQALHSPSQPPAQLTAPYLAHSPLLILSPLRVLLVAWVEKAEKERKVPR